MLACARCRRSQPGIGLWRRSVGVVRKDGEWFEEEKAHLPKGDTGVGVLDSRDAAVGVDRFVGGGFELVARDGVGGISEAELFENDLNLGGVGALLGRMVRCQCVLISVGNGIPGGCREQWVLAFWTAWWAVWVL
jgi:hypothetical protein